MYQSDLKDKEWEAIKYFFKRPDPRGNKGKHDKRDIVNAILYVIRGGIQWRMLPKDFPPWKTVYDHFRKWNERGVWDEVLKYVTVKSRKQEGREFGPSYGIVDSQSVKTQYGGKERGIDGGKKNQREEASHRGRHLRKSSSRIRTRGKHS